MTKFMGLLRRADGVSREAFLAAMQGRANLVCRSRDGDLERFTLDLVDVPPEEAGLRPGRDPSFDAVVELWVDGDTTALHVFGELLRSRAEEPAMRVRDAHLYRVSETIEKPAVRDWRSGERSPGIKSIYLAGRKEATSHGEFAAHWSQTHAPLALKHHIGMWRYVRNLVDARLTPAAPDWDGFAELHFRTAEDLRERMYDSPEGQAVIRADIARFGGPGGALHTTEHVLKAPAGHAPGA